MVSQDYCYVLIFQLFDPNELEKGTIWVPGNHGGQQVSGLSFDPSRGIAIIPTNHHPGSKLQGYFSPVSCGVVTSAISLFNIAYYAHTDLLRITTELYMWNYTFFSTADGAIFLHYDQICTLLQFYNTFVESALLNNYFKNYSPLKYLQELS